MRTGAYALSLLAEPLNVRVLDALGEGPRPLPALVEAVGPVAASTVRRRLGRLAEAGAVALAAEPELTAAGGELRDLAAVLRAWLARSPHGPIALEARAAREPLKAVTDAWSAGIVRALAAAPLGLTELDSLIADLSYPTLERRLAALRRAGLIEALPRPGERPYTVTRWLRQAAAPLAAAARWERLRLPAATAPVTRVDVEAGLLLALPLLRLPADLSGSCRLVVELEAARHPPRRRRRHRRRRPHRRAQLAPARHPRRLRLGPDPRLAGGGDRGPAGTAAARGRPRSGAAPSSPASTGRSSPADSSRRANPRARGFRTPVICRENTVGGSRRRPPRRKP